MSDERPLHEPGGISSFPTDSQETDENTLRLLTKFARDSQKRFQNPPLLLDDLRGLGMCGDLSEDHRHVTMSFEDAHRLTMTMRLAEAVLNEKIQKNGKLKSNFSVRKSVQQTVITFLHCWSSLRKRRLRSRKNTPSSRLGCTAMSPQ